MQEIDVLLEKYFAGETSLQEETLLKQLISNQSDEKYQQYEYMFSALNANQQDSILSEDFEKNLIDKLSKAQSRRKHKVFRLASLSIAASIVLAVGFFTMSQNREAYVIENGIRYDDMEKAVGVADEALNEAIAPLKQSMQSLQPITGLDGSLKPSFTSLSEHDSSLNANVHDSMMNTTN